MYLKLKIKDYSFNINIPFLLIGLCHFIATFFFTVPLRDDFYIGQIKAYFICKTLAFIFIMIFWQLIPYAVQKHKENNLRAINFIKYTLLYWGLNLLTLYFTCPIRDFSSNSGLKDYSTYQINFWCHFLNDLIPTVNYNILPTDYSSAICSTFVYALIFAYCIDAAKYKLSLKYYGIMIIPFCLPVILFYNLLISRIIYAGWLFLFLTFFTLKHTNDKCTKTLSSVIFGCLFGLLATIRIEYAVLIIIFPLIIHYFKIFDKKRFLIFVMLSTLTFVSIGIKSHIELNQQYEMHNLSTIYSNLVTKTGFVPIPQNDLDILKKVYLDIDKQPFDFNSYFKNVDFTNEKNNNQAIIVLIKILLKNADYTFYNKHVWLNGFLKNNYDFFELNSMKIHPDETKNDKSTTWFLYGSENAKLNNTLRIIYNPILDYVLLLFIIIFGIKKRNNFYSIYGFVWLFLLLLLFLIAPYMRYLYFYPNILNTKVLFCTLCTDLINKRKNKN